MFSIFRERRTRTKCARSEKSVLESKVGEGYIDTAVKMIIAVVIGGLLLTGFYQLINGVVLPGLAERIQDMFA